MLVASSMEAQNLFVVMDGTNIAELTPDGTQSTFVSGVHSPVGLAFNKAGNLFVGAQAYPTLNYDIYEYAPDGAQSTFAPAAGQLETLAFDSSGELFEADNNSGSIYEYTPGAVRSTFASGLGNFPGGMAFDRTGNLFVSDQDNGTIIKITPGGAQSTFASGLDLPAGLAFDKAGNLFVADNFPPGNIYEYTPDGVQSTFASVPGLPFALAFNSAGDLFVSVATSTNGAIVEITPEGTQSIFVSGPYGLVGSVFAFQPVPRLQAAATNSTLQVTVSMPSPYYSTIIQASTNLVDWVNICTNTPPFTLTNSTATTAPYRFYRATLGP